MPDSETVGQRLLRAFADRGITTKSAVAAALGYKSDKSIYKVINGSQELGFTELRLFSEKTGRSIDWLLFGRESMSESSGAEKKRQANESQTKTPLQNPEELRDLIEEYFAVSELVGMFHSLSQRDQAKLVGFAKVLAKPDEVLEARAVAPGTRNQKKAS